MSWLMGWLLDTTPWWLWAAALAVLLAATYQLWLPLWSLLPRPLQAILIAIGTAILAYLAGRNTGAAGTLRRAQEKEQAHADELRRKGAESRARADRDAVSGRLRDDDGWRREDR